MPSLIAFRRRWNISSDDFVFPGAIEAFIRLGWVMAATFIFVIHKPFQCETLRWFYYVCIIIFINLISIILCLTTAYLSAKGSILQMHARKNVELMLYIRIPLIFIELLWTIIATILSFNTFEVEQCFFLHGLRIAVILECFLIGSVFLGILIVFNPYGHFSDDRSLLERRPWQLTLFLCKLCQNNEMRNAIDDIALLLATFFADNDLVFSDIVAGLFLLVSSPHPQSSISTNSLHITSTVSWMKFPDCISVVSRIFDIAVATYGWPTYLFNNFGCVACLKLCSKLKCKRIKHGIVLDNCCSCHTSAFLLESGSNEVDLYMVSFRNRLFQVPFVVLTDHQTKSIVIAIRGSASISDLITDLLLHDEIFTIDVENDTVLRENKDLDENGEVRVHRGMLKCARYVYDKIQEYNVLEEAVQRNPTYNLVVCGHSLGGAIASLLTLFYQPSFPNIQCYSFSPPGCVVNELGIKKTEKNVLSIFVGNDIIPRISFQSLQILKMQIDYEIFLTKKPKYKIFLEGITNLFYTKEYKLLNDRYNLQNQNSFICNVENNSSEENCEEILTLPINNVYNSSNLTTNSSQTKLYPPGKLLCLNYDLNKKIEINWVSTDYLQKIELNSSMFIDHWPQRIKKILSFIKDESIYTI